jgi:thymidylate synthase
MIKLPKEACLFRVFEGQTADDAWQKIACAFRSEHGAAVQVSRNGPTHEILHAAISVADPRQRWVVSRNPPMNVAFALAEVVWIMAGRDDSAFLNYFNRALPKYSGDCTNYHGAYGYRLRKKFGLDQLERAYQVLSRNPESRQVVLQIWDSAVDLPFSDGQPTSEDIPCNIAAMLKVRDGALEWTQIMRSNDIFRGLPYNFVQFTTIQEIMAGWLNLKLGTYNHVSDSLHIYERDFDQVAPINQMPIIENADSLALTKTDFDLVSAELEQKSNAVADETVSAETLAAQIEKCVLPAPYRNVLCILFAEGARKRKNRDCINQIMAICTNPAYRQLYIRWLSRFCADE